MFPMVRSARRIIAGLGVIAIALTSSAPIASAKKDQPPVLKLGNACTMLTNARIEKTFGAPIVSREVFVGKHSCTYTLATDPLAPLGQFVAFQISPDPFGSTSALDTVNDLNSIEVLSNHVLTEVFNIGRSAYFNDTLQKIVVLASKKFAFELAWKAAPAGTPLDDQAKARLQKLAKLVVNRSKRAKG